MYSRISAAAVGVLLLLVFALPALAAPLFPDVPENHWARDAVATLAARGLVEGYPDGTFKGDRAATRWEVAMVVARLLAKMEQEHATFATKAELEELRKLVAALREELDALGVRVTVLEESTARLDQRVTELERITFYGSVETRFAAQTFRNTGAPDNDNGRGGGGLAGGLPYVNYNTAVGTGAIAVIRPQTHGAFPVTNYYNGRALTNGTGYSMRGILGLKIRVTEEIDAGAEFSAYTSQGDRNVDAYWGVSAPYLANPFTANAAGGATAGLQPENNTPFTRMVLDNFWVAHNPSKTKLILGSFEKTRMDPLVYAGQPNLGVFGPKRFAGFGFNVTGESAVGDGALKWEALGTRIGSGNVYLGTNYEHYVYGANLAYEFNGGAGSVKANFLRQMDDAADGALLVAGLMTANNVAYGASPGWSVVQWVNPPGYFAAQRSAFEQANTGAVGGVLIPNTVDTRPIAGWNGAADNAIGIATGGGNFGPQQQHIVGLSGNYEWELDEETSLRFKAEWAHSDYQSNRNSPYTAGGDALKATVGAELLKGDLDLAAWFLSVDPTYAPNLFSGNVLGLRMDRTFSFAGRFHLHDFGAYPHNREGLGLEGRWKFNSNRGALTVRTSFLDQKQTSLYDVRALPGSAGVGAPNFPVLGFSPGFIDYYFGGFAHPLLYGANSGSSFNDLLQPLENPRGSVDDYFVGVSHKWDDPRVAVDLSYEHLDLDRPTSLPANFGGSQNYVDLDTDTLHLGVTWDVDEKWALLGGFDRVNVRGHHDPAGLFNAYAVRTNSTSFANLDSTQMAPYLGTTWKISKDTTWDLTFTWYDTTDNLPSSVAAGRALDTVGATTHPFSWEGIQVLSRFNVKF